MDTAYLRAIHRRDELETELMEVMQSPSGFGAEVLDRVREYGMLSILLRIDESRSGNDGTPGLVGGDSGMEPKTAKEK